MNHLFSCLLILVLAIIALSHGISDAKPKSLIDTDDGTKFVWKEPEQTEECEPFACPDGYVPQQNPDYTPSTNGCGPENVPVPDLRFGPCCDEHDLCYDTCELGKDFCDDEFKKCMLEICGEDWLCKKLANAYYLAVKELGCSAYEDAQSNACICVSN